MENARRIEIQTSETPSILICIRDFIVFFDLFFEISIRINLKSGSKVLEIHNGDSKRIEKKVIYNIIYY